MKVLCQFKYKAFRYADGFFRADDSVVLDVPRWQDIIPAFEQHCFDRAIADAELTSFLPQCGRQFWRSEEAA